MSAGVCAVCLGAAPAFTGDLGQKPQDRVLAVRVTDVHGRPRQVTICHSCTQTITCAWARTTRRSLPIKSAVHKPDRGLAFCPTCQKTWPDTGYGHTCTGPLAEDEDEDEDDGPQSE